MRSIPKKLLIHTVTHAHKEKTGRWSDEELKDKKLLQYVRIEPSTKIVRDKNSAEVQLSATLFYDCRNSRPRGIIFAEDEVILFGDLKYSIQVVEPLYDGTLLHHFELGLIKYA